MTSHVAEIRVDYQRGRLLEADAPADPMLLFAVWMSQAVEANVLEPNAMTLATATTEGRPSARVVLLRGVDVRGFTFFTNYQSRKGEELAINPCAALCFWWGVLERQVRVEGVIEKLPAEESDAYFHSRPLGSRIASSISQQSGVIASRAALEARYFARMEEVETSGQNPARPEQWGGYLLRPETIEFWQGGPHRLHDRLRYSKKNSQEWLLERLSP